MKKETEKRICYSKIRKVGGRLFEVYGSFKSEIRRINESVFPLWKLSKLPEDIPTYIEAYYHGGNIIIDRYMENEFLKFVERWKNNDPKARETASKYKGSYLRPNNASMQIKKHLKNDFKEEIKKNRIQVYESTKPTKHTLFKYFECTLFFDPEEGLCIDGEMFLQEYDEITKGKESEIHERHEEAVRALNTFFDRCPVTWEEMERYFIIQNGRVGINPNAENVRSYSRLNG